MDSVEVANEIPQGFTALIRNIHTGEQRIVDPQKSKMRRMRKRITAWSKAVAHIESRGVLTRKVLITLSYDTAGTLGKGAHDWKANHIRDFMKRFKEVLGDDLLAAAWAAEMQKRGAVHYHIYAIVRKGVLIPRPDDEGLWPWGLSRVETGRSPFYLVSYLKDDDGSKGYQKTGYPKGCRTYSVWIRKSEITSWEWTLFKWSALPDWLIEELTHFGFSLVNLFPHRKDGGGWQLELPPDRQRWLGWKGSVIEFFSPWVMA